MYDLSANECYQKALFYKDIDVNKYFIFLTQSANHDYKDAIDLLHNEYAANNDKKQVFNQELITFYNITDD